MRSSEGGMPPDVAPTRAADWRILCSVPGVSGSQSGSMSGFETRFGADEDAERIRTAFYGFVERHGAETEGPAQFRTEISDGGTLLMVRLWSEEAMDAFVAQLNGRGAYSQ